MADEAAQQAAAPGQFRFINLSLFHSIDDFDFN
jgi:hypothetical protein